MSENPHLVWAAVSLVGIFALWDIWRRHIRRRERLDAIAAATAPAERIANLLTDFGQALIAHANQSFDTASGIQDALREIARRAAKADPEEIYVILRPAMHRALMFIVGSMDLLDRFGLGHRGRTESSDAIEAFDLEDPTNAPSNNVIDVTPVFRSTSRLPRRAAGSGSARKVGNG